MTTSIEEWTETVARDWLTEQVTLQSHFGRDGKEQPWIAPLEARWKIGDQWWEWVSGTEPLMQMGGIALVRDGIIVYAGLTWMS